MKNLTYIEEYIKDRKYNMPHFSVTWDVTLDGEIKYQAMLVIADDDHEDCADFVQANGSSLEEAAGKIAKYLKSGKHHKDGRHIQ